MMGLKVHLVRGGGVGAGGRGGIGQHFRGEPAFVVRMYWLKA